MNTMTTDELREWISSLYTPNGTELKLEGIAIADRIDADLQEAEDNQRFRREAEPFCDRLREASSERADVTLFGVDYIAMPLDADGVPIHIGDKVTEHEDGITFKVDGFMDCYGEWWVFMRDGVQAPASCCTHYHEPTVKDVLLEACKAYHSLMIESMSDVAHDMPAPSEIIEEYASKFRFADDGK